MSTAPKKKPYKLATVVTETAKKHPDIEVELADGKVVTFPPPQRWSDDILAAGNDNLKAAHLLLGDNYDAFIAEGGSASLLFEIIREHAGVDVGESSASTAS